MNRASGNRDRRQRRPAGFLLLVVLLLGAGCADRFDGQSSAVPVPVLTPVQTVAQSLLNLAEAGVLHYRGSLTNPNGKQVGLDVSVTATGEVGGSITVGGQQGSLVVVSGTLYVDAPAQFWSLLSGDPGSEADAVGSRWVKVPSVTLGADLGVLLRPTTLAGDLTRRVGGTAAPTATMVNGARADRYTVGASTVDIAATGTHGVLHVTVPSNFGTARDVSLDVADVSSSEAGIYQSLDQQAGQLQTAVDTNVDIEQGGQSWGTCTATGCSVVVTFTNAGTLPARILVSGDWTGDNRPAGTCQTVVGPVAGGKAATASCTNSSAAWASFYRHAHATPGQHPYEVDWTAEALAPPPNLGTLTKEAAAAAKPATGGAAQGGAEVYVINYQDSASRSQVWKYGVTENTAWRAAAVGQLVACRSVSHTSCAAELVTAAASRPSADALAASLVVRATGTSGCPPGQWVDCAAPPGR
jgi:hypothetical protein